MVILTDSEHDAVTTAFNGGAHHLRQLERLQSYRSDERSDEVRFRTWIADALLFAFREYATGRHREALRGLLQAYEYVGRLDGAWPSPGAHDAALCMKQRSKIN